MGFTLISQTLAQLWQANPKATHTDVYNAMMHQADTMKTIAANMGDNAVQGFIVWDYAAEDAPLGPAPTSLVPNSKPWTDYYATGWLNSAYGARYTGDPQLIHPALAAPDPTNPKRTILQAFFARLAPYKTGQLVRHGVLLKVPQYGNVYVRFATTFSYVWDILGKIELANKMNGCRLFYCDTNQNDQGFTLNARPFEAVKDAIHALSDFVAMEQTAPDGYEYTWKEEEYLNKFAGFRDPKNGKLDAATIVPSNAPAGSFRLIGPINGADFTRVDELAALVRQGSILTYHSWFPAPENEVIKAAWIKGIAPATA